MRPTRRAGIYRPPNNVQAAMERGDYVPARGSREWPWYERLHISGEGDFARRKKESDQRAIEADAYMARRAEESQRMASGKSGSGKRANPMTDSFDTPTKRAKPSAQQTGHTDAFHVKVNEQSSRDLKQGRGYPVSGATHQASYHMGLDGQRGRSQYPRSEHQSHDRALRHDRRESREIARPRAYIERNRFEERPEYHSKRDSREYVQPKKYHERHQSDNQSRWHRTNALSPQRTSSRGRQDRTYLAHRTEQQYGAYQPPHAGEQHDLKSNISPRKLKDRSATPVESKAMQSSNWRKTMTPIRSRTQDKWQSSVEDAPLPAPEFAATDVGVQSPADSMPPPISDDVISAEEQFGSEGGDSSNAQKASQASHSSKVMDQTKEEIDPAAAHQSFPQVSTSCMKIPVPKVSGQVSKDKEDNRRELILVLLRLMETRHKLDPSDRLLNIVCHVVGDAFQVWDNDTSVKRSVPYVTALKFKLAPEVLVRLHSLKCLAEGEWYNDEILDLLIARDPSVLPEDCFILRTGIMGDVINNLSDPFTYIPVDEFPRGLRQIDALHNYNRNHWVHVRYAISDGNTGLIVYHDSLCAAHVHQQKLQDELLLFATYLSSVHAEWKDVTWQCSAAPCPLQENYSDCGPLSLECLRLSSRGREIYCAAYGSASHLRKESLDLLYDALHLTAGKYDYAVVVSYLERWLAELHQLQSIVKGPIVSSKGASTEPEQVPATGLGLYTRSPNGMLICTKCGTICSLHESMALHYSHTHPEALEVSSDRSHLLLLPTHKGSFHVTPGLAYHCSMCPHPTISLVDMLEHMDAFHDLSHSHNGQYICGLRLELNQQCKVTILSNSSTITAHLNSKHYDMLPNYPDMLECKSCKKYAFIDMDHGCKLKQATKRKQAIKQKQMTRKPRNTTQDQKESENQTQGCGYVDVFGRVCQRYKHARSHHTSQHYQYQCHACPLSLFALLHSTKFRAQIAKHTHKAGTETKIKQNVKIVPSMGFAIDVIIEGVLAAGHATIAAISRALIKQARLIWSERPNFPLDAQDVESSLGGDLFPLGYLASHWSVISSGTEKYVAKIGGLGRSLIPEAFKFWTATEGLDAVASNIRDPMEDSTTYDCTIVFTRYSMTIRDSAMVQGQSRKVFEAYWALHGKTRWVPPQWDPLDGTEIPTT